MDFVNGQKMAVGFMHTGEFSEGEFSLYGQLIWPVETTLPYVVGGNLGGFCVRYEREEAGR